MRLCLRHDTFAGAAFDPALARVPSALTSLAFSTGSVTTAIAFGIIVDDTTHFLSKYLKARREGPPAPEAVRHTFRVVGQALWTTTLVLAAGFLVFALSGFEVSWSLGLLVTSTIIFAVLADFLLLPPLLLAIDRKKL